MKIKKYFVIGNPIQHSLSPKLHNYWLKKNNIGAVYDKIKLEDNQIKDLHLSFLSRRETERLMPTKTVEERMISFQRDCEERMKRELDAQVGKSYRVYVISWYSLPTDKLHEDN